MNNEKSIIGSSSSSSSYDLSCIVFQKMLIKNFADSVAPELQKYRLPNLVASYARRLQLARNAEGNPKLSPTRIIISDFSKKPTEAERISNLRGNLNKDKNKKSSRGSKRRMQGGGSLDAYDRKFSNARLRKNSRQSFSMKPISKEVSKSIESSFKTLSTAEISSYRGSAMRKSSQNRSKTAKISNFISPFQLYSHNTIPKTRVKLKDFSKSLKGEPMTSSRAKQLKEIDDLILALNDSQISRKTLERALLVPEDVIKIEEKLYYKDFEYIRSWMPESTHAAHSLVSGVTSPSTIGKEPISAINDNSGMLPLSDNVVHIIGNDLAGSAKTSSPPRKHTPETKVVLARKVNAPKTVKTHSVKAAAPAKTRKKSHPISVAKMLVKPLDLIQSESDQYLDRTKKPKTSCWWNASELKMLRTKLMNKKENEKHKKVAENIQNDKFKTANQISRPNSHTAHHTTKYMKSPSSIDQLPIEPQLDRQYIMHTQAVAQGRNYLRNSIWLPSQRPISRPQTSSLFHMDNGSITHVRRRSFSLGNHKLGVSVELPAQPSHGYLQIYAPREYPHHLI